MPKGNSGRQKNSMAGRQSRDLTIKNVYDLERVPNKWTNDEDYDNYVLTSEANKIMKIIQNAPVGTEITLKGVNENKSPYEEKYRITGTLRNKMIEPLGKYERYTDDSYNTTMTLKKTSLNKDSFVNIFSGSPDHSYYNDKSLHIHMKKTPKTASEKKAQKEESNIERRQLKLFR